MAASKACEELHSSGEGTVASGALFGRSSLVADEFFTGLP